MTASVWHPENVVSHGFWKGLFRTRGWDILHPVKPVVIPV